LILQQSHAGLQGEPFLVFGQNPRRMRPRLAEGNQVTFRGHDIHGGGGGPNYSDKKHHPKQAFDGKSALTDNVELTGWVHGHK
jgi:hypothetical protein